MKFCKCKCGTEISDTATWAIGHHRKGKSWNAGLTKDDHPGIKSRSEKITGKPAWNVGKTGEQCHMYGKQNCNNGKHINCGEDNPNFGKKFSEDTKLKMRNAHLGKSCENRRKPNLTEEQREVKRQQALRNLPKLMASDKNYDSPIRNKKISDSKKEQWKNIEWKEAVLKKVFASNEVKPNKLELSFQTFLDKQFPGEWKYVGDGQIWIAGKCPDFWNMNGRKAVIELFGTYWHKPEDEEIRKAHFGKYGYETIIVWDHELSNKTLLLEKLQEEN